MNIETPANKTILNLIKLHEEMQNNAAQLALIARSEQSKLSALRLVDFHKAEAIRLRGLLEEDDK